MDSIRIINGLTLECMGTVAEEHNPDNVLRLIESYVPTRGRVEHMDWSSDCITIAKYEDGSVIGFSI